MEASVTFSVLLGLASVVCVCMYFADILIM